MFGSFITHAKKFSSFPSKPKWLDVDEATRYKQEYQVKALLKAYGKWLKGKSPNGKHFSEEEKKMIGGQFKWELESDGSWSKVRYMSPRCKALLIKTGIPWPTLEEPLDPWPAVKEEEKK